MVLNLKGEVYIKVRSWKGDLVVAVCDKEILGKTFREGELRIHVKEEFYGGELVSVKDAIEQIKKATIANLVGSRIISEAIEEGLLHKDSVIYISGIPHVQIVKV